MNALYELTIQPRPDTKDAPLHLYFNNFEAYQQTAQTAHNDNLETNFDDRHPGYAVHSSAEDALSTLRAYRLREQELPHVETDRR